MNSSTAPLFEQDGVIRTPNCEITHVHGVLSSIEEVETNEKYVWISELFCDKKPHNTCMDAIRDINDPDVPHKVHMCKLRIDYDNLAHLIADILLVTKGDRLWVVSGDGSVMAIGTPTKEEGMEIFPDVSMEAGWSDLEEKDFCMAIRYIVAFKKAAKPIENKAYLFDVCYPAPKTEGAGQHD